MYQRSIVATLSQRMSEPRRFLQILIGPRQTGKTTAVTQALKQIDIPYLYREVGEHGESPDWIRAQWYQARSLVNDANACALLVIDEIQYVKGWADTVKALWDEDARTGIDLRVVLTGSSATLLKSGMDESLAGRFELIRCTHWTYGECRDAFGFSLDDFLFFGGYPGAAGLREDVSRWASYVTDAIIEPSIAKDVLALEDVRNPALLRRLFYLGAPYSAQEVSYRKLLGQLDDRGNTATIAHYLELLAQAGMMSGILKYDPKLLRERSSSPRLLVHDTALMTAAYGSRRRRLLEDPDLKGHLVESAVGAYLIARSQVEGFSLNWWRDGSNEVDFVVSNERQVLGIEVKSGRIKSTGGLTAFVLRYPEARTLIVGSAECTLEDFLLGRVPLLER
ncbi:MAG: ATP-binding protein [Olsenella sp.]|jgi:predicted AAA+ superfamily ATPase|nr:ATP-binding protein [Olsenella sp.]